MSELSSIIIRHPVTLKHRDLREMMRLTRALHRLASLPDYRARIHPQVPEISHFNPGHDSVMMGYDFHITESGPRLIEVNTNAGGLLPTCLSHLPEKTHHDDLVKGTATEHRRNLLLKTFSEEYCRFSHGDKKKPQHILILEENPEQQFLYIEMKAYANMFRSWGVAAIVADPAEVEVVKQGVFCDGELVDLIYNRHCDFYLETPAMAAIREAYLEGRVCLTPNPFTYALLADKRRMILWSDRDQMEEFCRDHQILNTLSRQVPHSRMLSQLGREQAWTQRKNLVFKPVSRYGSRGVYIGRKITRKRFETLPEQDTLVQTLVPPSQLTLPGQEKPHKVDYRLFAYRDRILGVTARLYRGQVTSMSTDDSGFAPVVIE